MNADNLFPHARGCKCAACINRRQGGPMQTGKKSLTQIEVVGIQRLTERHIAVGANRTLVALVTINDEDHTAIRQGGLGMWAFMARHCFTQEAQNQIDAAIDQKAKELELI